MRVSVCRRQRWRPARRSSRQYLVPPEVVGNAALLIDPMDP
jgi:hypothetical protein